MVEMSGRVLPSEKLLMKNCSGTVSGFPVNPECDWTLKFKGKVIVTLCCNLNKGESLLNLFILYRRDAYAHDYSNAELGHHRRGR